MDNSWLPAWFRGLPVPVQVVLFFPVLLGVIAGRAVRRIGGGRSL